MNKTLRVLMLEDNPGDADLNAAQLADAGLAVDWHRVENEQDYLRELADFKPDVILADYRLPRFDGITALRLAQERFPFIPFIVVSGALEEAAAVDLLKSGAADYVLKHNIVRLGPAVRNALEIRRAKEEKARAEDALRSSHAQLEQRVKERTAELEQLNKEFQQEIEERKRAEQALRESREDLNRAQAVAHIGSWRLNVRRNELRWSDEVYRIFGVPIGTPMTYKGFLSHVYAEDRTYVDRRWKAALTGEPYDIEHRISVQSNVRWVREKAELECDGKGAVLGGFGIVQDITERKQAEERLRQLNEELTKRSAELDVERKRWKSVVEGIADEVWIADAEGRMSMVNLPAVTHMGLEAFKDKTVEQILKDADILTPEGQSRPPEQAPLLRALKGETVRGEEIMRDRKTGRVRWRQFSASPLRDTAGVIIGSVAVVRDITDAKNAEEALRRNEYELRTLVDNSPDLIFRLNRQLRYVYANPAYERLTGIPREQFIGKTNEELGMTKELAEFWRSTAQEAMESGREHSFEFDMTSFFGKRYFLARLIPEFAKTGLVETVLVIARDITERKHAEEQIRYISFHDEVTGLYNRAFFEEEIRRADAERELPISIIMGDVNNLKLSNDVFGHGEGDKLLKAVADIFRKACRKNDVIARWGGDEFAVILPRTDLAAANEVYCRVKQIAKEARDTVIEPGVALGIATKEQKDQNIYQIIRRAEERMYQNKLEESRENEHYVYDSLFDRARERNRDIDAHIERSYAFADRLGDALHLSESQRDDLRLLVKLHDIGDAVIPPEIMAKPGRLNPQEWEQVKGHVEAGFRIVKTFADTARISDEVLSHAERWDGSGYPRGLKGKEIPYLVRVFTLIDVYDVITHARPYARTFSPAEAAEELKRNAGKQFDPEMMEVFIRNIPPEGPGTTPA